MGSSGGTARKALLVLVCAFCCAVLSPAFASAAESGEIAGHIEEAGSGTPVDGGEACAYRIDGGEGAGCTHADVNGDYIIEGLPEGEYEVVFSGQACVEAAGEEVCETKWAEVLFDGVTPGNPPTAVEVKEGERTSGIDAVLEAFGQIEGTVTSPTGPVADTLVCIDGTTRYWPRCAATDGAGVYFFPAVPPGEFVFEFTGLICNVGAVCPAEDECLETRSCTRPYVPQYYEGLPIFDQEHMTPFPVNSHATTTGPSVELTPGGSIEGTVTVAALGSPPAPGVNVCSFPAFEELRSGCATTDANGQYKIEGLATGTWLVEFNSAREIEEGVILEPFVHQYFDGETEEEDATPIAVTAPGTGRADGELTVNETARPGFVSGPVLSGTATPGATLGCGPGTWSDYPTGIAFSWQRDAVAIPGQSAGTYVVGEADEGASLTCTVTVSNAAGSASATSNPLAVPKKQVPPSTAPQAPSTSPPPPPPSKKGTATAAGKADATAKTIPVKLTCNDAGPCSGNLKLAIKKAKIGAVTPFSVGKGGTKTIKVKLNATGVTYLEEAGKQAFKVKLSGSGVKSRTLTVRPPRPKA